MKILGLPVFKKNVESRSEKDIINGIWYRGNYTSAGKYVTWEDSLKVTAVFSCIRILSESISTLPLHMYKRLSGGGKERAYNHPLYSLLHDEPNLIMDSVEFFSYMMVCLCMRGNHVSRKIKNYLGEVTEIVPFAPDRVRIEVESNGLVYVVSTNKGELRLSSDEVFHVKGMSIDGVNGLSPIDYAKESIALAMAAEEHGARFFANGITPSGILVHPTKLSKEAGDRLKAQFRDSYGGSSNSHSMLVMEEGMKFEPISLTNEQSQFIETRKFQVSDIARWFRVPPHMIGDLERATFSNIEQQSLEFVTYTLTPWLVRIEKAIKRQLLSTKEKQKFFVEFLVDGLLRGDGLSRAQKLQIERQNGIINANEWREIENRNPLEGDDGEAYITPLNMKSGGQNSNDSNNSIDPSNNDVPAQITEDANRTKIDIVYPVVEPMLKHQIRKICGRQSKAFEAGNFNSEKEMQYVFSDLKPCSDAFEASLRVNSEDLTGKFVKIWHEKIGKNELKNEDFILNLLKNEINL